MKQFAKWCVLNNTFVELLEQNIAHWHILWGALYSQEQWQNKNMSLFWLFPVLVYGVWLTSVKLNSWWHFFFLWKTKKNKHKQNTQTTNNTTNLEVQRTVELLQDAFWWVIIQLSEAIGRKDIKNILQLHSFSPCSKCLFFFFFFFLPRCTANYSLCRIFIRLVFC